MAAAAMTLLLLAITMLVRQYRWSRRLSGCFDREQPTIPDDDLPRAAVILSLRGADPSLRRCLQGILQQNYPDYEVRIVIDSNEDPSAAVVAEELENCRTVPATVKVLCNPLPTCSLKSSSILQTLRELDDSFEAIAIVDSDVVPHQNWLRDLMSPLHDPAVGAANGLRWFAPAAPRGGDIVRKVWGIGAAIQMHKFRIPWGGSLAIRRDVFRDPRLIERWRHHATEDASLFDVLRQMKLRLVLVPAATMINCETADLVGSFRFIRRQLLWLWLSHSSARRIVDEALVSAVILWLPPIVVLSAVAAGDFLSAALALAAWMVYQAGLAAIFVRSSLFPRRIAEARGESVHNFDMTLSLAVMGLVTQVTYQVALVSMLCLRRIEWRGVSYRFGSAEGFRMVEYRTFISPAARGLPPRQTDRRADWLRSPARPARAPVRLDGRRTD
jgi:cellulose synthase/poly-beta-1,6-N-acetylglucosamine synthase-like glycosyltransferase